MPVLLESSDKRLELSRTIYGSYLSVNVRSNDKIIVIRNLPTSMTEPPKDFQTQCGYINPILNSKLLVSNTQTRKGFFEALCDEIQKSPAPHCSIVELAVPAKSCQEILHQKQSDVQLPFYAKNLSRSTNELFHFIWGNHELELKHLPFGEFGLLDLTLLPLLSIPLMCCFIGSFKAANSIFECSGFLAPIALIPFALAVVFGLLVCVNESLRLIAAVAVTLILSVPRAICRGIHLSSQPSLFPAEAAGFFKPVVVTPR